MFRSTDPFTSALAARQQLSKISLRESQVLAIVCDFPGRTAGELAAIFYQRYPKLGIVTAVETPHKRLTDLERKGEVVRGEPKICGQTGHLAHTWSCHAD